MATIKDKEIKDDLPNKDEDTKNDKNKGQTTYEKAVEQTKLMNKRLGKRKRNSLSQLNQPQRKSERLKRKRENEVNEKEASSQEHITK